MATAIATASSAAGQKDAADGLSLASHVAIPDRTVSIDGLATRLACVRYANRVFLTVSQLASFGSLYFVEAETYEDGMRFFNVRCLLGAGARAGGDDGDIPDVPLLFARRAAEMVL